MKEESNEFGGLKIENISKSIGWKHKKKTIDDITLEFNESGMVFITGENGSGKATLLNILGLLDNSYTGSLYLNNKLIGKRNNKKLRNEYYNYIFQEPNLIDDLNIEDNIKIVDILNKQDNDIDLGKFEHLRYKYPKNLSGGEKQIIAIKRGLREKKSIYLCDEPTASLDYTNTLLVLNELKEVSKSNLVIVVMHNPELVAKYADRIIELQQGKVIKDEYINETSNITLIKSEKTPKLNFRSFIKLVLSSVIARPVRTTLFFLLSLFFMFGIITVSTFLAFDVKGQVVDKLKVGDYYTIRKNVYYAFYNLKGGIAPGNTNLETQISNSDRLYNLLKDKFNEQNIDYVIDDVHFTDQLNIKSGEALIGLEKFKSYFGKKTIEDNDIYSFSEASLGITNLKLKIVGFSQEEGLFTPKSSLIREGIENSFISTNIHYDLYDNTAPKLYGKQFEIISLSKLKKIFSDDYEFLNNISLNENEIILSNSFTSSFTVNPDKSVNIPTKVYFPIIDKQIKTTELVETILNIGKHYENGASVSFVFPQNYKMLGDTIIVNDNVYISLIEGLKDYYELAVRCTKDNKKDIAEFYINNNYVVTSNVYDYAPNRIVDLNNDINSRYSEYLILIYVLIAGNIIALSLFTTTTLSSKRKEIGLLQSFGLSKFKSFIPAIVTAVLTTLLSFIIIYAISPLLFNSFNSRISNNYYYPTKLYIHSLYSILASSFILIFVILFSFLLNIRKIKKYSAKDIFKFN